MTDREIPREIFLKRAGWGDASIAEIAGDASERRYFRLTCGPAPWHSAVLSDASALADASTVAFLAIDEWLLQLGLSAPKVMHAEAQAGFLLLEDFGDLLFSKICAGDPTLERQVYSAAVSVLSHLHAATTPAELGHGASLPIQDIPTLISQCRPLFDHYAPMLNTPQNIGALELCLGEIFAMLQQRQKVVVLRDYHAGNLIWLPDRSGLARVGLLDFQDALLGQPAYDLVSLLQDARRDISRKLEDELIDQYLRETGQHRSLLRDYAILGAQRHLRVLGIFARLARRDGKVRYLVHLSRVWSYLMRNLEHPDLDALQKWVTENLPDPARAIAALRTGA